MTSRPANRKAPLSFADSEACEERLMGIEPTPEAWEASVNAAQLTATSNVVKSDLPACTAACTSSTESGVELYPDGGFAAAVLAIMALPLTDDEKAEALRRLLASER